ncbi:MAG: hemolysin family protein [Longicatena sp.]
MEDPIYIQIFVQIVLITCNAIFACAEIAVISMNDNKLAQMVQQGDKRAIRLARLTSQPARFLATIQVAITLSGFFGSAFAADSFSDGLVSWMLNFNLPISASTLDTIAVIFITLVLSYFTLVFGELVPKRIAMKKAESLALGMSTLITFISQLFSPLVCALTVSTNGILRLCGIDPNAEEDEVSEEEIRMMVDIGNQKGVIDFTEREMIQKVFEFDDLNVGDFAIHRMDVSILWMDESEEEWEKTIHESRHTLYPVCNDSVDDIVGILNIKDYFRLKNKNRQFVIDSALKPAHFVPEHIHADILFKQMQKSHNHFAIVLDEYGGMTGIITMNDLLEQLVGELDDMQEDNHCLEFEQMNSETWKVRGNIALSNVAEKLNVVLPVDKFDTFGGFVFNCYGYIPNDGTQFTIDAYSLHIQVTRIKNHCIEEALICSSPTNNEQ